MMSINREELSVISTDEITAKLRKFTCMLDELSNQRSIVLHEISQQKDKLKTTEKSAEKQNSRLERLKLFIDNEQEQKEQLESTLAQNARPTNVREKLYNIHERMACYKREEEKLLSVHCIALETARNLNASIIKRTDEIIEIDLKCASVREAIALMKHRLKKLKSLE